MAHSWKGVEPQFNLVHIYKEYNLLYIPYRNYYIVTLMVLNVQILDD